MNHSSNAAKSKSTRIRVLAAVTAVAVTAACGTGIAAFAGLLPASKGVALAMTTTPLIDVQFAGATNARHHFVIDPDPGAFAVEVEAARGHCRPANPQGFAIREVSFAPSTTPSSLAPNV
ncbi:hypothetical protein [Trinickia violacea]|uniref:hypothetical protein n=1 Tax=Trinickia violacea TaxID=2571746 RepID=UPI0015866959|nr:hypothetical protein [Trinickia violacea]